MGLTSQLTPNAQIPSAFLVAKREPALLQPAGERINLIADMLSRVNSGIELLGGQLDLAFAVATTPLPPGARSEAYATDKLALVMRRDLRPLALTSTG